MQVTVDMHDLLLTPWRLMREEMHKGDKFGFVVFISKHKSIEIFARVQESVKGLLVLSFWD